MADAISNPALNAGGLPATLDQPGHASLIAPLTDPAGGPTLNRIKTFMAQPPVKKALPWFAGMATLGSAALAWATLAPAPQRVLYTQLDDSERASVVSALDKGNIHYRIDSTTGAVTVDEPDLYKARMLVAQNGALAMPDTASDGLDKLPMGASHALETERLRAAREHELMLSIKEIDGVQSVRVHIAEGEKSVFVRDSVAPSASVMLRLADGRQLSDSQVTAIVNLVAASVPGMSPDAVKVVDQEGRLLSQKNSPDASRLELQSRMEEKLQGQVTQLLTPMLGDGNFTSEVQVDLDMDQVTSARESYDKQGAIRSETEQQSQQPTPGQAMGVPGALSNTPPPAAQPSPGAPQGTPTPTPNASPTPMAGESSASRTYELGREVAVSNQNPGKLKRLSVAVAISPKPGQKFRQPDIDQIKQLVSAAVGADPTRGDQVAVVVRSFETMPADKVPFYATPWFSTLLHYGVPLLGLLMVLFLGVRPLIKALRRSQAAPVALDHGEALAVNAGPTALVATGLDATLAPRAEIPAPGVPIDADLLGRHVNLAQQIVAQKRENAVIALRQMLQNTAEEGTAA